jgi:glycosyltransferase involved in cell wall biosynthesis
MKQSDAKEEGRQPPFFSVIIPTHNRAGMLGSAIQSVCSQTFRDWELIVVDDHSGDETPQVVASFKDSRIRCLMNERTPGGSGARNTGIFSARGAWIAFLDDDDVWIPRKLEMQHEKALKAGPGVGVIYGGYSLFDNDLTNCYATILPEKKGWLQRDLLYSNYVGVPCTVAVEADLCRKVGGFDESFPAMQDLEFYVRVAGVSKFDCIREVICYVREDHNGRVSDNHAKRLHGSILFLKKYRDLIKGSPRRYHRLSSIIFLGALRQRDWPAAVKTSPWILAGILVDLPNFLRTVWGSALILTGSRRA